MSEASMRAIVILALKGLHAIPIENSACPGTPDINYQEGWIELKQIPKQHLPKRETTPLPLNHFTQVQRVWIRQRKKLGGRVFVVLKVRLDWFILPPLWAVDHLGIDATLVDIFKNALLHLKPFDKQRFKQFFDNENRT